jgi:predicted DNA-binding protein
MPTIKKRINITLDSDMEEFLSVLAKRDQVPEATKAAEILREAIELQEEIILAEMAHKRFLESKGKKRLTHKQVWG